MIDANGKPLTREQTLQIRRDSSRGMSSEQIGASILRNRQARLAMEADQPSLPEIEGLPPASDAKE